MPLAKHQPQAPRWACVEERVRRGRVGRFVCSAGFEGCTAARSPANISPPATRQWWWGGSRSKLPPVGSPAVPKPPGGRERGAGQSSRLCSAAFPKASPLPEPPRWEGRSQPRRRTRGEEQAQVHAASPPRPHASPGKVSPSGETPWLSVAPGGYIHIYIVGWGSLLLLGFFLDFFKYFFSPAFLRFAWFFLFLRFWC